MGKDGDLWDDSALVDAFDDAMTKYKIMHSKKNKSTNIEGGNAMDTMEDDSANANKSNGVVSSCAQRELEKTEENNNVPSSAQINPIETKNLPPTAKDHSLDLPGQGHDFLEFNGVPTQDRQDVEKGYSYPQSDEAYNQLISQYNELEVKREKMLQQLYQYGYANYQYSGEGTAAGANEALYSAYQENPITATQASCRNTVCSYCPNVCPCFMVHCTSYPVCSSYGTCVGKTCIDANAASDAAKPRSTVDDSIIQTAMDAAKKAMSSLKMDTSDNLNEGSMEGPCNGTTSMVNKVDQEEMGPSSSSSETDLTVVLNAWYSAGFYTGKYLTEQATIKKK